MSLDVYIQPVPKIPQASDDHEYVCSLDNDGYYWYLFPLFEDLGKETGQFIDLYDGAIFGNGHLDALQQTLEYARQLILAQPDYWEVVTGYTDQTMQHPVYANVEKSKMLLLVDNLIQAVASARATDRFVLFFGD